MDFYAFNLAGFAVVNAFLLYRYYKRGAKSSDEQYEEERTSEDSEVVPCLQEREITKFFIDYFPAYAFAVAADWIQGPHIYAIYKYDKQLPERLVAALYAAGFVSGAASASFVGRLADRFGRRMTCLIYGLMYIITCFAMLSDNLVILFFGRLAGGVATTILFSIFDVWMVAEYHSRGLSNSSLSLSTVFSYAAIMSPIIAIAMGVAGDGLVQIFGSRIWPFMGGVLCSLASIIWIYKRWDENYGSKASHNSSLKDALKSITSDSRIMAVLVATTCFESSMYLFVFFWSAALNNARVAAIDSQGKAEELPFGLIFACFMCAMMAGSCLFNLWRPSFQGAALVLMCALAMASLGLSSASMLAMEKFVFYAFVAVEASIGLYFPAINLLKSEVISDDIRGSTYSLMRLPLNLFVVITHSLDEEGKFFSEMKYSYPALPCFGIFHA
ncbi:hypothetical protein jhhlp_001707 [Lomentospora prolificans]|uniref:Molybdate-anion transporter n=1 Tax=Lomentospora prolificans TaxID=41688 RepID=A0A2N3NGX7_9PEZI|nr:hypothetical protein jhhlp_001707 [Lomentospora prolificans]